MAATLGKMKEVQRYAVASRNQEKHKPLPTNGDLKKHMALTKNWQTTRRLI